MQLNAEFDLFVAKAKGNLLALSEINQKTKVKHDWQVTICFYAALHLVNAHLAAFGINTTKHIDTFRFIDPANQLSLAKIEQSYFLAYQNLSELSRKARYDNKPLTVAVETKRFLKSLRYLDNLMTYFSNKYRIQLEVNQLSISSEILNDNLPSKFNYFQISGN